jgi:hypothetical protein
MSIQANLDTLSARATSYEGWRRRVWLTSTISERYEQVVLVAYIRSQLSLFAVSSEVLFEAELIVCRDIRMRVAEPLFAVMCGHQCSAYAY